MKFSSMHDDRRKKSSVSFSLSWLSRLFLFIWFFWTCWGWSVDMFGFEQETTPRRLFKSASEKRQTSVTSCQPIRPFQPLRRPFLQQLPHPPVRTSERQSRRRRFFSFHSAYWHWSIVIILSIQGDFFLFCFDFTTQTTTKTPSQHTKPKICFHKTRNVNEKGTISTYIIYRLPDFSVLLCEFICSFKWDGRLSDVLNVFKDIFITKKKQNKVYIIHNFIWLKKQKKRNNRILYIVSLVLFSPALLVYIIIMMYYDVLKKNFDWFIYYSMSISIAAAISWKIK